MKVDTTDLDKKCEAIYRDAIKGLKPQADIEPVLDEFGRQAGQFSVEGVSQPTIQRLGDGRWRASIAKTCNPWAFTIYINETADDAVTALNAVHERVIAKDWR